MWDSSDYHPDSDLYNHSKPLISDHLYSCSMNCLGKKNKRKAGLEVSYMMLLHKVFKTNSLSLLVWLDKATWKSGRLSVNKLLAKKEQLPRSQPRYTEGWMVRLKNPMLHQNYLIFSAVGLIEAIQTISFSLFLWVLLSLAFL